MEYKYLAYFTFDTQTEEKICTRMDTLATILNMPPLYEKMRPHVSLHVPIINVNERVMKRTVEAIVSNSKQFDSTLSPLTCFGKEYIASKLLMDSVQLETIRDISDKELSRIPQYDKGLYGDKNTLHVSYAEKLSELFDTVWPEIETLVFDPIIVHIKDLGLSCKPVNVPRSRWELIAEHTLPL